MERRVLVIKGASPGLAEALAAGTLAHTELVDDLSPTGRMKSQVRRKAAAVASNPKQTAEQKAWNDRVEAERRAKKGHK